MSKIEIYTDGACTGNGKKNAKGGVGVYFGDDSPLNVSEKLNCLNPTNNLAELTAIDRALDISILNFQSEEIIIYSDSNYSIKSLTQWGDSWEKNGWKRPKNQPIANLELIKKIRNKMKTLRVKLVHVRGHSDNYGNNYADRLAVEGCNK